jgi:N-acetylmuramoyl-L-alanine amidase
MESALMLVGRPLARAVLLLGLAWLSVVPAQAAARLHAASLAGDAQGAIVTLRLSAPGHPNVYVLSAPARLVIDLPATSPASTLRLPAAQGMVRAVRGSMRPHGSYRLVLELAGPLPARPRVASVIEGHSWRLQVRLVGSNGTVAATGTAPASQPAALAAPAPLAATAPPAAPASRFVRAAHEPSRNGRDIVIAIDAGHGGEDPGASGPAGTHEKDVVLAIARAVAARLNEQPGMHAVLTRDADRLIDLRERMDRARDAHADLFVSIHADSVRDRAIAGASVYTLSYRGASSEAARWLADRENAAVLKGGVSLAGVNANLASLLLDVSQSANMGASVEAADQVLGALDRVGAVRKPLVQHAAFVVLKSPDLPSMLVETAYISNPAEERKLRSPAYQAHLASAIQAGVVAYFRAHPPDGTLYANQRREDSGDSGPQVQLARDGG